MKKIDGLRKSIQELDERESKAEEMLQSACAFLEEGNERMAKGVADKNMNEIEAAQNIIELAQEKQKKAKQGVETVHKEKRKITNELSCIQIMLYSWYKLGMLVKPFIAVLVLYSSQVKC